MSAEFLSGRRFKHTALHCRLTSLSATASTLLRGASSRRRPRVSSSMPLSESALIRSVGAVLIPYGYLEWIPVIALFPGNELRTIVGN